MLESIIIILLIIILSPAILVAGFIILFLAIFVLCVPFMIIVSIVEWIIDRVN